MKITKIWTKIEEYLKRFSPLIAGIIVMVLFLVISKMNNLFPFGNKTIAWCDMEQQAIPLLNQLKDILEGKQSLQYSFLAAGGMSFFSIFFFFLSNPFSFLVVFIDKADTMGFMNILVMLKLILCAITSCWYIRKKYEKLPILFGIGFSLLYAFSAYNLMYYQNLMWLDVTYLFPVLFYSIDLVLSKRKNGLYITCILLTIVFNYYIGALTVFFVLMYVLMRYLFELRAKTVDHKNYSLFLISSLVAGLLSGIFVVPSFLQYIESARTTSFIESLRESWFITSYQTTIPLLLPTLFLVPFIFIKNNSIHKKCNLIMLILLLIPIIVDPINKAWHFGSYQAFPCRFAFIITFLVLDVVAQNMNDAPEKKWHWSQWFNVALCFVSIVLLYSLQKKYLNLKLEDLNAYSSTLWGDLTSLEALLRYYSILFLVGVILYICHAFSIFHKKTIGIMMTALALIDVFFSTTVYMVSPAREDTYYREIYELQSLIEDDSFYRVKTDGKYFSVNHIGGLGYNTIAHYTSLTTKDDLFTMKKLGYSSYWMEVGAYGGTIFTDALLLNKYTITNQPSSDCVYKTDRYGIIENKVYPFGTITTSDLSKESELEITDRSKMQDHIYQTLFSGSEPIHTFYNDYEVLSGKDESQNGRYHFTKGTKLRYKFRVEEEQHLYFECFDKYTNSLRESIEDSLMVTIDNKIAAYQYPSQQSNGTLDLSIVKQNDVTVTISVLKDLDCSSFSLFGVNINVLEQSIQNCKSPSLQVTAKNIVGTYEASEGDYLFLPISYSKSLKARINNSSKKVERVFSNFVALKLEEGTNEIEIYYVQNGGTIGAFATISGSILLGILLFFKEKVLSNDKVNKILSILLISIGCVILFTIYGLPLIMNIFGQIT